MFLASVMRMHEFLESLVDGQARPLSMNPQTLFPSTQSDLATRMPFIGLLDEQLIEQKAGEIAPRPEGLPVPRIQGELERHSAGLTRTLSELPIDSFKWRKGYLACLGAYQYEINQQFDCMKPAYPCTIFRNYRVPSSFSGLVSLQVDKLQW